MFRDGTTYGEALTRPHDVFSAVGKELRKRLTLRKLHKAYKRRVGWRHAELFGPDFRRDYTDVESFCVFSGYPRSGHSLIGSLLDAHPNLMISHELHVLPLVHRGMSKWGLFHLIRQNTEINASKGRSQTGYSYSVPGAWQGRFDRLVCIGDKKGGGTSHVLTQRPEALRALRDRVGLPLKVIHITRNPYDNIATMAKRSRAGDPIRDYDLRRKMRRYFVLADLNHQLMETLGDDVITMRHEDVIADPKARLAELVRFLGAPVVDEHLEKAASIVYASPNASRHKVTWPDDVRQEIDRRIPLYPFLRDYAFDDSPPRA